MQCTRDFDSLQDSANSTNGARDKQRGGWSDTNSESITSDLGPMQRPQLFRQREGHMRLLLMLLISQAIYDAADLGRQPGDAPAWMQKKWSPETMRQKDESGERD